jgi:hypothetical protein
MSEYFSAGMQMAIYHIAKVTPARHYFMGGEFWRSP